MPTGASTLCTCLSPAFGSIFSPRSSSSSAPIRASTSSQKLSLSPVDKTLMQINKSGVIACLRANSAEMALEAAHAALRGGIQVMEIVMSTPGVFEVLRQLVKEHPSMALGVGTVLRLEDAQCAVGAGAKFLMSPVMVTDIMDYAQRCECLYIPGAMTPTEIFSAYNAGAKIVKVYPVSSLGGFHYISALKKSFSHISMIASQGITLDSVGEYIARGASSVVLSDAIFDQKAMAQNNLKRIYELAQSAALQGNEIVERNFQFATREGKWIRDVRV